MCTNNTCFFAEFFMSGIEGAPPPPPPSLMEFTPRRDRAPFRARRVMVFDLWWDGLGTRKKFGFDMSCFLASLLTSHKTSIAQLDMEKNIIGVLMFIMIYWWSMIIIIIMTIVWFPLRDRALSCYIWAWMTFWLMDQLRGRRPYYPGTGKSQMKNIICFLLYFQPIFEIVWSWNIHNTLPQGKGPISWWHWSALQK